ncbi:conserved hypothetical protein [Pirellula staleyi DSM 6068]|uniref:AAA+ ATPase domain-containing protein n=1 Tax=Pirellula staleyi (strain ATCC 27377 / DSM 6068 / ICPB 4128) TaxID=530564 RepID=D2R5I4_PIRSD|nr:hypothetical protein [Pirellula staleyi]ADB15443.1 conserved hypothetical protein [Pirellula staleyi DSM 6068]
MNDPSINPFATRYTRPGELPYLLPDGLTIAKLVDRLKQQHWRGAIVGPHGSGKSSLLAACREEFLKRERILSEYSLHNHERTLANLFTNARSWNDRTLVIVDGYEQLSWRSTLQLAFLVRIRRAGLVVTVHAPTNLPTWYETVPSAELAEQVAKLAIHRALVDPQATQEKLDRETIHAAYHGDGNIRETLFRLYDIWRAKQS